MNDVTDAGMPQRRSAARAESLVEFESGSDHQHRVEQAVQPVATFDNPLDTVLTSMSSSRRRSWDNVSRSGRMLVNARLDRVGHLVIVPLPGQMAMRSHRFLTRLLVVAAPPCYPYQTKAWTWSRRICSARSRIPRIIFCSMTKWGTSNVTCPTAPPLPRAINRVHPSLRRR